MNYICIGKFVNTHGLKGEIRILSDFDLKDEIFKVGNYLYIDNKRYTINSYRKHKNYDMVTFKEINSINDIEIYKGKKVYVNREDYNFEYIMSDLIGFDIFVNDNNIGSVYEIVKNDLYPILKVSGKSKFMVPYIDKFIQKLDLENNRIYINYIKGLYDED